MLDVKDLTIAFYNREEKTWSEVVHQINFRLAKGKVLGIVGESGSGKSVTSFSIMRLHDAQNARITGTIDFDHTSLLSLPDEQIRSFRGNKISMIFQEPMTSLNPVHTCGNQVMEAIILHQKISIIWLVRVTCSINYWTVFK